MKLEDLLKESAAKAPKPKSEGSASNGINWIFMHAKPNQGTIRFIPIEPTKGAPVRYLYGVSEWQVNHPTDDGDDNWKWSRIPQSKDYLSELTPEAENKVNEIHSYVAKAIEMGYETDWARNNVNYAIMFGYVLYHQNNDGEVLVDGSAEHPRKMALLVFKSKNIAGKMKDLMNSFVSMGEGGNQLFQDLFNRNTERKAYLEISFVLGGDGGFGYSVSIAAKPIDIYSAQMLNGEEKKKFAVDIDPKLIDLCHTPSSKFITGADDTDEDYNDKQVTECYEAIRMEINKEIASKKAAEELPEPPKMNNNIPSPQEGGWPTAK